MRAVTMLALTAAFTQAAPETFAPAQSCALCHARVGAVGQYALWSGSLKAHAALDPYWKARVEYEKSLAPEKAAATEAKCLRCHAPAAGLAVEGVTCTVCHQIGAENLGEAASFSGGFRINGRGCTAAGSGEALPGGA